MNHMMLQALNNSIYCNNMYKGISKVLFVDICTLDDGKADTILEAILKTIDELEVNKCNAVGFEIDRAAVMTGCKNGLAVKLQNSGAIYLSQIHRGHMSGTEFL